MRAAVRAAFVDFTAPIEGCLPCMYLDVKDLCTTGIGNLIDPVATALRLPWTVDGRAATREEIVAEWYMVKSRTDLAPRGGDAFMAITRLRLLPNDITNLVIGKVAECDGMMRHRFASWDTFPADAQLALLSMSWAVGTGWPFLFPKCSAAVDALDFATCAGPEGDPVLDPSCRGESWMRDAGNPGLRPRNLANKLLFANAAKVVAQGLDREALYYPHAIDG